MLVSIRAFSGPERYVGATRTAVEVPPSAKLQDLWLEIDRRWGRVLRPHIWDQSTRRFRRAVIIMSGGAVLDDDTADLSDEQEVFILPPVIGG
jgi:hypothetical protein